MGTLIFLPVTLPPCTKCGSTEFIAAEFPGLGHLVRCEQCKQAFKPETLIILEDIEDPSPAEV